MITIIEVVQQLEGRPDRMTLESYIERAWVRPVKKQQQWHFEDIDVARIRLVHQLRQDMAVNDDAMDVVLHLLDQVYSLREQMRRLSHCIQSQPENIRTELYAKLGELNEMYADV